MWIIQLIIEILKFVSMVVTVSLEAKAKADAANEKFTIDQAALKAISDEAWVRLRANAKKSSTDAASAWDKEEQDKK